MGIQKDFPQVVLAVRKKTFWLPRKQIHHLQLIGSSRGTCWKWIKGVTVGIKHVLHVIPKVFQHIAGKGFSRRKLLKVAFQVKQRRENA